MSRERLSLPALPNSSEAPTALFDAYAQADETIVAIGALEQKAYTDRLTGLDNRMALEQRTEELIADADSNKLPFAVFFIDLDGFKQINDTLGHEAGDEHLRTISGQYITEFGHRKEDFILPTGRSKGRRAGGSVIGRLGGDEFMGIFQLVHNTEGNTVATVPSPKEALPSDMLETAAESIKERLQKGVNGSVGYVVYDPRVMHLSGTTLEEKRKELWTLADHDMYREKTVRKDANALPTTSVL